MDAGKDVYCGWPLTTSTALSGDLAALKIAREKRHEAEKLLDQGRDPAVVREAKRQEKANMSPEASNVSNVPGRASVPAMYPDRPAGRGRVRAAGRK